MCVYGGSTGSNMYRTVTSETQRSRYEYDITVVEVMSTDASRDRGLF